MIAIVDMGGFAEQVERVRLYWSRRTRLVNIRSWVGASLFCVLLFQAQDVANSSSSIEQCGELG